MFANKVDLNEVRRSGRSLHRRSSSLFEREVLEDPNAMHALDGMEEKEAVFFQHSFPLHLEGRDILFQGVGS